MNEKKIVIGLERRTFDEARAMSMLTAARSLECDLYCFTPDDIDLNNRKIKARVRRDDDWIDQMVDYPDVIDNDDALEGTESGQQLMRELPCTHATLGDWNKIHELLADDPLFRENIAPHTAAKTKSGLDFGLRLIMQRGAGAQWKVLSLSARFTAIDAIADVSTFLKIEFGLERGQSIEAKLIALGNDLVERLQLVCTQHLLSGLVADVELNAADELFITNINGDLDGEPLTLEQAVNAIEYARSLALDHDLALPTIGKFMKKFRAVNGEVYCTLDDVYSNSSGIEFAVARRANMFKDFFGFKINLLTHYHQTNAYDHLAAYDADAYIINAFDYYQGIDRKTIKAVKAKLPPMKDGWQVDRLDRDIRILRADDKLEMYCVFDLKDNKLDFINFFNDDGRKIRRDYYDSLGFINCRQTLDPVTENTLRNDYFHYADGSIAVSEFFDIKEGTSELNRIELFNRKGKLLHTLKDRKAFVAQWLFDMFNNDKATRFILTDRATEYFQAYSKLNTESNFKDNNFVLHVLHNIYYYYFDSLTPLTAAVDRPWYEYLVNTKIKSDALLTLTNDERNDLINRFNVLGGKRFNVVTLPHPLPQVRPAERTNFDPYKVVLIGRVVDVKGHAKAVNAFKQVLQKVPKAHLHFYGNGEKRNEVQKQIDEAGLGNSIKFEGFVHNVPEILANSALLLLPSSFEGFPLVIQEALQNSCPVIAFDCKYGPSDIIVDDVNGYLVKFNDIDALADRIIRVLSNPELQRKLSRGAARSVARFTRPVIAEQWAKLMLDLMEKQN